jgi:glycosyltransferase involved in cell wall biosynthesis
VLDCPTDESDKVAEAFAAKDSRIKLIYNKENLHVGLSRNKGMEQVSGKYIGFCDHDDYCAPTMFELLYNKAESEELDVVRCNRYVERNGKLATVKFTQPSTPQELKERSMKSLISQKIIVDGCVTVWNHIYRSDFIRQHTISFIDTKKACGEDYLFSVQAYHYTNKINYIPDYLYYHVIHSTNTSCAYEFRSFQIRCGFLEALYEFVQSTPNATQYSSFYPEGLTRSLYGAFRNSLRHDSYKKTLHDLQEVKKNNQFIMKNVNYFFKVHHIPALLRLKPTLWVFLVLLKLIR